MHIILIIQLTVIFTAFDWILLRYNAIEWQHLIHSLITTQITTNCCFSQCYPAKHPEPLQTRQHYLAKKPYYSSSSEDHGSAAQLGSLFILSNFLITTLANATQLSNQSTFRATSATWLNNQIPITLWRSSQHYLALFSLYTQTS